MTALWLYVLGRQYTEKDIPIPYSMIAGSLVSFVVPLVLGALFKYKWPKAAAKAHKWMAKYVQ